MMTTEIKPYNPFNNLLTDDDMGDYLTNAFLDEDPAVFVTALGHIARHKGITQLANDTGLNRESLYKALSGKTQPRWDTIQRIIKALNIQVKVVQLDLDFELGATMQRTRFKICGIFETK